LQRFNNIAVTLEMLQQSFVPQDGGVMGELLDIFEVSILLERRITAFSRKKPVSERSVIL